ncbi:MAG: hypothetical protein JEY79_08990 [Pseudodesulfovibrio sp.]|nr:hypothetical protein [Pseudodesulfovibrio sp.]
MPTGPVSCDYQKQAAKDDRRTGVYATLLLPSASDDPAQWPFQPEEA